MGWGELYAVSHSVDLCWTVTDWFHSVSVRGTEAAKWDKDTWGPLEDLAKNHPDAGVHFQGMSERYCMIDSKANVA